MSRLVAEFTVPGIPAAQGSKRGFVVGGRARIVEDGKRSRPWRTEVHDCAVAAIPEGWDTSVPVVIVLEFAFMRPKSHLTALGKLRKGQSANMRSKPDLDKLARNVLDAITGALVNDDAQVAQLIARKFYVDMASGDPRERPGLTVRVWSAEEP